MLRMAYTSAMSASEIVNRGGYEYVVLISNKRRSFSPAYSQGADTRSVSALFAYEPNPSPDGPKIHGQNYNFDR